MPTSNFYVFYFLYESFCVAMVVLELRRLAGLTSEDCLPLLLTR